MLALLLLLAGCGGSDCALRLADDTVELSGCADLTLSPTAHGEGLTVSLDLDGPTLTPIVSAGPDGGTLRAVSLHGPWSVAGERPPRLWRQGYQSWWWSGVVDLEPPELDDDGLPRVGGDAGGLAAVDETPWSSWWVGVIGRPDGDALLLGALASTRTKVWTAFSEEAAWVVWGGRGEALRLDPGETLRLDPLRIDAGPDAGALLRDYAAAAAAHVGLAPREDLPPTGWGSWNQYYADLTQEDVLANLAALPDEAEVLLVDDGWELTWGDWTANERFPLGTGGLAAAIHEAGHTPGLWMAPFYVDAATETAQAHPDWFVRDLDGQLLGYSNFGPRTYRTLDLTHPEAAAWLRDVIAARVAEGWTFLKLDFLYAGAVEGLRHEDVTGAEAYARGVALLREAAGPDAFLLACGAPMLPSLGHFDAYRTGADIAFEFDPDPRRDYLRWQARATAARAWQNGAWWWIDPDVMLLREPFTATDATGAVAAQVASGGLWLLGDDLEALDPDRRAMALSVADLRGQVAMPDAPLRFPSGLDFGPIAEAADPDDLVPARWTLDRGEVVLLNLGEAPITVDGPGGTERLSGATAAPGPRTLAPGAGEVWSPVR